MSLGGVQKADMACTVHGNLLRAPRPHIQCCCGRALPPLGANIELGGGGEGAEGAGGQLWLSAQSMSGMDSFLLPSK